MVRRHGVGDRFFFVSLDVRGAVEACRTGSNVILLDDATHTSLTDSTKAKVSYFYSLWHPITITLRMHTQGGGSEVWHGSGPSCRRCAIIHEHLTLRIYYTHVLSLTVVGIDFFFLEMDVWLLRCKYLN